MGRTARPQRHGRDAKTLARWDARQRVARRRGDALSAQAVLHAKLLLEAAPEQSEALAKPFINAARAISGSVLVRAQRYWKIERYSEVSVAIDLRDDGQQAFSRLMSAVGIGWNVSGS